MSELIRREDAIKATWKEPSYADPLNVLTEVRDRINAIPAAYPWRRVEDGLPESNDAVNVVWVNRNPESYYADIKDKPFVSTAHYHKGKWYWFSSTCKDFLDEYGRCEVDEVDKDIDILYWMPLPSPPVNKMFTKINSLKTQVQLHWKVRGSKGHSERK